MRRLAQLRDTLEEFVVQQEHSVLLLEGPAAECAYAAQQLAALDQRLLGAVVLIFAEPYVGPVDYAERLVRCLREQMHEATLRLKTPGVHEPPPPPPELVAPTSAQPLQAAAVPQARLRAWLQYLLALLSVQDKTLALALLPQSCSDGEGFARWLGETLGAGCVWLSPEARASLRLVSWCDRADVFRETEELGAAFGASLRVRLRFAIGDLTAGLGRDAADVRLPMAERMTSLLQLAALDYSYRRYTDALGKYALLHRYYSEPAQPTLQALCLAGTGDSLVALGRVEEAKRVFECGIALCREAEARSVLLNLVLSLVPLYMHTAQCQQASALALQGALVAVSCSNPHAHAILLELAGDAEARLQRENPALECYERCRAIAERYGDTERLLSLLPKMVEKHWGRAQHREARALERRLIELRGAASTD